MALLIFLAASKTANKVFPSPAQRNKFKIRTAAIITGWIVYITILSLNGVFASVALPPRIPLLLVLPAFAFTVFFFTSSRFKSVINATPAAWVVYAQSFRIVVELLLAGLYVQGILPRAATFEGYNFDIVIGITSLLVGYFAFVKNAIPPAILITWNVAGFTTLAIVVFIVISHAYRPGIWADGNTQFIKDFGAFPYTLLAGFLMPLAVFLHIFSIVKTTAIRKAASTNKLAI